MRKSIEKSNPPSRSPTKTDQEPPHSHRFWAFLERLIPKTQREFLIGDLIEEFQHRVATEGRWRARAWACREILALVSNGWIRPSRGLKLHKEPAMAQTTRSTEREFFATLLRDLRVAGRRWLRSPTAALVIVATLTLGIGLNTLVFMLADLVLFRPPAFDQPERLISIQTNTGGPGWYGSSEPELVDLERLKVFDAVGAWSWTVAPLASDGDYRRLAIARVSAQMLPLLGVEPQLGRFPGANEGLPGTEPVVVIKHDLWQKELGGRQDVIGESLLLGGMETEIIGVMPPGFSFPVSQVAAWMPLPFDRADLWGRSIHYLNVVGRLSDEHSVEQAAVAVSLLADQSALTHPEFYAEQGFRTQTQNLRQAQTVDERS